MEGVVKYWWVLLLGMAAICQAVAVIAAGQALGLPPPHHRPLLTEDQKLCLERLMGKPDTDPPREVRRRAYHDCGVGRTPATAFAGRDGAEDEI